VLLGEGNVFYVSPAEYWQGLIEVMKGGWVTKRASSFIYIIPSTYTGEKFGLLKYLTLGKENYGKY